MEYYCDVKRQKRFVFVFYRKKKKRDGKEEEEEDSGPYRSLPSFGLLACCSLNSQNIQMTTIVYHTLLSNPTCSLLNCHTS